MATDQQGNGTLYQYWWPCCGGGDTNFFQVNGIGETYGLIQASGGNPTPDPQWPYKGGANFAVNPVNGQDIVISSAVGRIFTTTNGAVDWFDVGDPSVFGSPGSFSLALAYGAPDPSAPGGVGDLGEFIYVGTAAGQIYVTQDGGGSGGGNNWINISTGLDGSTVEQIITDPTRGSHDAYAITVNGVYYIANSIPSASNPTPTWVNITGNLKTLAYSIFGQNYDPATDPNAKPYDLAITLSSIAADWRYSIPSDPSDPSKGTFYPVLYVGADSGVYQSINNGQTWTFFPDTTYGAVVEGGYLPHVSVTSLSLSLGDINPNTGMPTLDGPYAPNTTNQTAESAADPDTLMAATYGQGEFAINLAPLILGDTVSVAGATPGSGPNSLPVADGPITISGSSEITSFGNATWITIEDVTNPADPFVVAGFNPADPVPTPGSSNSTDALGNFSIMFNPETAYTTNGMKTIEIFATDNAGSVGNVVTYSFVLNPPTQLQFNATVGEPPATAVAGQNFAAPAPVIIDVEDALGTIADQYDGPVTLELANNAIGTFDPTSILTVNAVNGVATFSNLAIDTAGTYELAATSPNLTTGISTSIMITAAAPAQLVWATEPPSEVTEDIPLAATLNVLDQYGNLEATDNQTVSVTLDLNGTPANSDLTGTTTVTASGGVATFSNIIINTIGDPFTLIATSGGLTSPPSGPIDVVGPTLVVTSQPTTSVTAGVSFALTVTAETYLGTVDTGFSGTVGLTIGTGPTPADPIAGTTSAIASSGVATFTGVILDTAGAYVLQASSGNLIADTNTITVVAAAAAGLSIVEQPPTPPATVQAGAGFGFEVGAVDQFGNPTTLTGSVSVTVATSPPGGSTTLGGATTVTAHGGVASFTGLTLNNAGSGYILQVSDSPLAPRQPASPELP